MRFRSLALLAAFAVLASAPSVLAQEKEKSEKTEEKPADAPASAEADKPTTAKPNDELTRSPHDPTEDPKKTYYFVGASWRQTLLPHFMFTPFVAGGPSNVWIPTFRGELTMRKESFDTVLHIGFSDFGMDAFGFRGKNESPNAWEVVKSDIKTLDLGTDFLWSTDFDNKMSFQYGVTTALRIVFGDLRRVQGKYDHNNPDDAGAVTPCEGNGAGGPAAGQPSECGKDNDHYGSPGDPLGHSESSWVNGGSKPNLYVSFGPQVAFRFKPVKEFMGRVFLGWDIFAGPFFGLSANYGL
jgi:hypothetical protein